MPSVTAKIRCADFSARTERGEVLRQTPMFNILPLAAKRGKTTAERVGFSLCHSKVIGVRHREMDFRSVLDEGDDASPNGRRHTPDFEFTLSAHTVLSVLTIWHIACNACLV